MPTRLCLLALLATATAAQAMPVYKCVGEGGKVTYSQNPCYGENWHRLGERRVERKPAAAPQPATSATATKGAGAVANGANATATAPGTATTTPTVGAPATSATPAAAGAAAAAATTAPPAAPRP